MNPYIAEYVKNMELVLTKRYPNKDPKEIRDFIIENAKNMMKRPMAQVVTHPEYGKDVLVEKDLLKHMGDAKKYIITPRGTSYMLVKDKESELRVTIKNQKAGRSKSKKLMLKAENEGDAERASYYNNEQSSKKFTINSIFGSTGNKYNFLYDLAGFNAITSLSRTCIVLGYTHTERLLQGCYYIPTDDDAINYMVSLMRVCPDADTVLGIVHKFCMKTPSAEDLYQMLQYSHYKYTSSELAPFVRDFIYSLREHERVFIYYAGNLKTIFQGNEEVFRGWIDSLFPDYDSIDTSHVTDLEKLFSFSEDLLIMLSVNYGACFNYEYVYDLIKKDMIDEAKKVIAIAEYITSKFKDIDDILKVFVMPNAELPSIERCKGIKRETVVASDTDSVIFTTVNWVKWYTGTAEVSEMGHRITSLVVYLLTISIEQVLEIMCRRRNVDEGDMGRLYMKNEFMYVVFLRTMIKKHYFGKATIKEGRYLGKPKIDIKGVGLRGSTQPKRTLNLNEKMMHMMMGDIEETGTVSAAKYVAMGVNYEKVIYDSILRGDLEFIPSFSIKDDEGYADSMKSIHFNYTVWQELFAEKYGDVELNAKTKVVPLIDITKNNAKMILGEQLGQRVIDILVRTGKRALTRMPINHRLTRIPEELIPAVNKRKLILANNTGIKLILSCLGVSHAEANAKKNEILLGDMYNRELYEVE